MQVAKLACKFVSGHIHDTILFSLPYNDSAYEDSGLTRGRGKRGNFPWARDNFRGSWHGRRQRGGMGGRAPTWIFKQDTNIVDRG